MMSALLPHTKCQTAEMTAVEIKHSELGNLRSTTHAPMSYKSLLSAIAEVHASTRAGAAGALNQYLTLRNWVIGAYIVEFEQNGDDRASYGQRLLSRLSGDLRRRKIPGCSPEMLGRMRFFYRTYPQLNEAVSGQIMPRFGGLPAPIKSEDLSAAI